MSFSLGSSPLAALLGGFLAVGVVLLKRKVESGEVVRKAHAECQAEPRNGGQVHAALREGTTRCAPIPKNSRGRRLGKPLHRSHRLCRWTAIGAKIASISSTGRASGFHVSPHEGRNRRRKRNLGPREGGVGQCGPQIATGFPKLLAWLAGAAVGRISGAAPPANSLFRLVY